MDLNIGMLGNFHCVLSSVDFFLNYLFQKISFWNAIGVSKSMDPDQARHFVGFDQTFKGNQKLELDRHFKWIKKHIRN